MPLRQTDHVTVFERRTAWRACLLVGCWALVILSERVLFSGLWGWYTTFCTPDASGQLQVIYNECVRLMKIIYNECVRQINIIYKTGLD